MEKIGFKPMRRWCPDRFTVYCLRSLSHFSFRNRCRKVSQSLPQKGLRIEKVTLIEYDKKIENAVRMHEWSGKKISRVNSIPSFHFRFGIEFGMGSATFHMRVYWKQYLWFLKIHFFLIILYVVVESCLNSRKFLSYLIKGRQNRIKSRRG